MILNNITSYTPHVNFNFKASLLNQMMQKNAASSVSIPSENTYIPNTNPGYIPVVSPAAEKYNKSVRQGSLLTSMINRLNPSISVPVAAPAAVSPSAVIPVQGYRNNLRSMFQNNQAVIYAMIPRTFNAKDTDGNGLIEGDEEPGYFTNMVERLDELKTYGINTLHWLPINPPGEKAAKGNAGSVYAPKDYLTIDPALDDPRNPMSVNEEAKYAINECHKRGIKVMVDLPSCMSVDLYDAREDLRATDANNNPKTPEGWEDIRMFNPWEDADRKILNRALLDYHKKFIDLCLELGIDGIRADVGRAKPPEFWDELISYTRSKDSEFAFLAECYTYEDASPMKNMPADRPEEALESGFDSFYGQYHIFHQWKAKDFHKFVEQSLDMTKNHDKGKSLIGSFATHDDKSPMSNGGPDYCMMTNVVQATLPMTNPYIVTGFESGDRYIYRYKDEFVHRTFNELLELPLYKGTVESLLTLIDAKLYMDELNESGNSNMTIGQLSQDSKYSKIVDALSSFENINKFIQSNPSITLAQIQNIPVLKEDFGYVQTLYNQVKSLKVLMKSDNARNMSIEQLSKSPEFKNIIQYFEDYFLTKDNIKYYVSPEHVDIFNKAAKPEGDNPEIGQHFGYLMNCVRPKYGELITKGNYIELNVKNNGRDEVIAYARCKDGKTLVTIVNHDVNARQKVKVEIPGLKSTQVLTDLSPKYGTGSSWAAKENEIEIDLGPAQAHIFEVDTPYLTESVSPDKVFQQNL